MDQKDFFFEYDNTIKDNYNVNIFNQSNVKNNVVKNTTKNNHIIPISISLICIFAFLLMKK